MDLSLLILDAVKFIFPAYCANAIPVIVGGGRPIDFGKSFIDGRPIFGSHKTIRGFFSGLLVGTLAGLAMTVVLGYPLFFGLVSSLGALLGDLCGAFVKRRLGIAPGGLLPVIDQIDFVVGAILVSLPFVSQILSWPLALTVLIITPPIHLLTNYVAYKLRLKSNPW
jgi:CDP-2,3-bis-(O-geranylgeranyl)-sn-glycerol synthase